MCIDLSRFVGVSTGAFRRRRRRPRHVQRGAVAVRQDARRELHPQRLLHGALRLRTGAPHARQGRRDQGKVTNFEKRLVKVKTGFSKPAKDKAAVLLTDRVHVPCVAFVVMSGGVGCWHDGGR